MIRPVRIHGIFEQVDPSKNSKGLDPSSWLAKKALYKKYIDSLNVTDESLYERLLEEYNEGLLFNIDFKFLMSELGYGEDVVDAVITKYDAGEKPYGTSEKDIFTSKKNYIVKDKASNIKVDPEVVASLLDQYRQANEIEEDRIKRGR